MKASTATSRVSHHIIQSIFAMASYLEQVECLAREISNSFPGNDILISQIITVVTTCPPTFTYLHDPYTTRITASLVNALIASLSAVDAIPEDDIIPTIASAQVNAVACFTSRLFYDTTLNRLAKWHPRWDDGCNNWPGGSAGVRYNDSLDGFLHGLRVLHAQLGDAEAGRTPHKSRLKVRMQKKTVKMVLIIERAERLKESLPELLVPLTRLAELVRPLTINLLLIKRYSSQRWIYILYSSLSLLGERSNPRWVRPLIRSTYRCVLLLKKVRI
jgi:origin recognition complex subunit 5